MSKFNKDGIEFKHLVQIAKDPNGPPPTYSHSFPVVGKRGKVEERWSTKVRPIKDMTRILQGNKLRRHHDYVIDYNEATQLYEYWFLDSRHAMLFQIAAGNLTQSLSAPQNHFSLECPHCQGVIQTKDFKWV